MYQICPGLNETRIIEFEISSNRWMRGSLFLKMTKILYDRLLENKSSFV